MPAGRHGHAELRDDRQRDLRDRQRELAQRAADAAAEGSPERRLDPAIGAVGTWDEYVAYYGTAFTPEELAAYWQDTMTPVAGSHGEPAATALETDEEDEAGGEGETEAVERA